MRGSSWGNRVPSRTAAWTPARRVGERLAESSFVRTPQSLRAHSPWPNCHRRPARCRARFAVGGIHERGAPHRSSSGRAGRSPRDGDRQCFGSRHVGKIDEVVGRTFRLARRCVCQRVHPRRRYDEHGRPPHGGRRQHESGVYAPTSDGSLHCWISPVAEPTPLSDRWPMPQSRSVASQRIVAVNDSNGHGVVRGDASASLSGFDADARPRSRRVVERSLIERTGRV